MHFIITELLAALLLLLFGFILTEHRHLNDYIQHYEELNYDRTKLHDSHHRAKRSMTNPYLHLEFHAHGRYFNLRLRRDTSTFSKDLKIEVGHNKLADHDTSYIYEGTLWGEPETHVYGSIIVGTFAGVIHTPREIYHVERADKYFTNPTSHSIIYAEKDVDLHPYKDKSSAHNTPSSTDATPPASGQCGGSDDSIREWMREVQMSAVEPDIKSQDDGKPVLDEPESQEGEVIYKKERFKKDNNLYVNVEDNHRHSGHSMYSDPYQKHQRIRRAPRNNNNRRTCTLFLQSDIELWNRMTVKLGYDANRAREEITSLFATHVSGIKKIYEDTSFNSEDNSLRYSGISFVVHRVKINETERDCPEGENTIANTFCKPNIDVSNFLNINSLRNHDDFCLAYVFTYRDFTGGTLGLAWVGAPNRASGGICERWKEYQEAHQRVHKSLNTGIVTLINYGTPVPPKVSTLTFAHEVGHNFGSPHDSGHECTPFTTDADQDGNYIMYASATSGDRPNNSKFSPCSKWNITKVIHTVVQEDYGKKNCFVEREAAFCGNNIVEEGEECDCGYAEDCEENCCYGRTHPQQCQRRANAQCSPSEGPCCNSQCEKISQSEHKECSAQSDCNMQATCNGLLATCPSPAPRDNGTACNDKTQVCISGECIGSICQKIGWKQCFLEAPRIEKGYDKGKLCYVACHDPRMASPDCISTGDVEALQQEANEPLRRLLKSLNETAVKLPPGAPCNNFRGYCDVFQKCRDVDADGPLSRLKKLLFNEQTFNEIRTWIVKHWWAVLLMGVALVICMALFIQICAVHTPSSNPKKAPARKLTLKRQPRPRQQGPPPPYAGPSRGGPPHGKGRGPSNNRNAYSAAPAPSRHQYPGARPRDHAHYEMRAQPQKL